MKKTAPFLCLLALSLFGNLLYAGDVTIDDNGATVVMSNGIVSATIVKASASVIHLNYNGEDLLKSDHGSGRVYWSWNMPAYQNPSNSVYTLTADPSIKQHSYGEIRLHMPWSGLAKDAAMDVDVYYSLTRDASGIYAYGKLTHPAAYPANPGGEWRMVVLAGDAFDWMTVDSARNRIMPTAADIAASTAVAGAPKEVMLLHTGVYANHYECKYDYSADLGDLDAWGWSSTTKNMGIWITAPSKEYYSGGPMHRELICHASRILLNMFGGTHYGMGGDGRVAAGENWQKTYGPFLIYCNKTNPAAKSAYMTLWKDAIAQAKKEQAAWPYKWFTDSAYSKEAGRGTVTGRLVINDISNASARPGNMWVGLAIAPPAEGSIADFQKGSKGYQFWVKTDDKGSFVIPHVLPGSYDMYAFGPGAAGQMKKEGFVMVTPGKIAALGKVEWTPDRTAPTVWEIGIPDRSAAEFRHGKDWWTGHDYPDTRWARFMDYKDEFPNDIVYSIGQSNWSTDWNYVQQYNMVGLNNQTSPPRWTVKFNLTSAPTANTTAAVYLAFASSFRSVLMVRVNDTNITPDNSLVPPNRSNATIRKGIHGAFGDSRITFPAVLLHAGANEVSITLLTQGGDVQYDYLRLEAQGTAVSTSAR